VVTLTVRRRLDEVRRLQKSAGVEAKHHDIRTAPRPMTVAALASSQGERLVDDKPHVAKGPRKPYGTRPRHAAGHNRRTTPSRSDGTKRSEGQPRFEGQKRKDRWSKTDKRTR
jgi:hypothetical protein